MGKKLSHKGSMAYTGSWLMQRTILPSQEACALNVKTQRVSFYYVYKGL